MNWLIRFGWEDTLAEGNIMTDQEAEQLSETLARVWRARYFKWVYWPPFFRFDALLAFGVLCHLQEDGTFVLSRNRWASRWVSPGVGEEYQVSTGKLRCSLTGDITSATANTQIGDLQKDFDRFVNWWMPRFRRNCCLSGREIECTPAERRRWQKWFNQETSPLPESERLSAVQARQVDWQGRRLVAAFEGEAEPWHLRQSELMASSTWETDDGIRVRWNLGEPFGDLYDLTLSRWDNTTGTTRELRITRFRGWWRSLIMANTCINSTNVWRAGCIVWE